MASILSNINGHINLKAIGQRIFSVYHPETGFFTKSHVAAILDLGFPPKTIGHMVLVILMPYQI